ncbi:MAG: CDP-glucose 4,6-dehydratase [Candidatus Lokiarchaeota archaeon]|nr:CDP-glucose 4,6-dehydratase [Candidatus Lokiarchaeota archaeon]
MIKYFGNFFEDKKVLITGHTGFIGSWLTILLNELSAEVIGYALPPYTEKDNFVVTNLEEKITHIIGDIRDSKKLNKTFKKYKPDITIHLAAQPIVRKSYIIPKETYEINIGGTVNLLEAFRNSMSCKVLINFTTDKVYENLELKRGYDENDRLGGFDPYSSSKACSELITSAYRHSFFNTGKNFDIKFLSSVRCGNIIGGGDWQKDRLISDCMRSILTNKEIYLRNPDFVRPWQYVLEPIRGLLMLATKMWDEDPVYSSAWNFGPTKEHTFTVRDVIEKIIAYLGKGKYNTTSNQCDDELHETELLILDSDKANKYLNWRNEISIDEAIKFLCDWYTSDKVNYEFDTKQIYEYLKKIKM